MTDESTTTKPFVIAISMCGSTIVSDSDGQELRGQPLKDLLDCSKPGDVEPACEYLLEHYKPEIRIVRKVQGKYENVLASAEEKRAFCREVYPDSESNFSDEHTTDLYIVWQAACSHD